MKLCDMVRAVVIQEDISNRDIENTIAFLVQDNILTDVRVFRRIVKNLVADLAGEDAYT